MEGKKTFKEYFSSKEIAYMGICLCLLIVSAYITIPLTVPITLQTFAVALIICFLGFTKSIIVVLIYLIIGAVGIPVFSGFSGGIGYLLSSTGGYLIGFVAMTIISGGLNKLCKNHFVLTLLSLISGLVVCYIFGTLWFMYVNELNGFYSFLSTLSICVLPFLVFDIVKIALALVVAIRLKIALKIET